MYLKQVAMQAMQNMGNHTHELQRDMLGGSPGKVCSARASSKHIHLIP